MTRYTTAPQTHLTSTPWPHPCHAQTYLDHAFGKLDHDGDGFISLDELISQLPPLRPAAPGPGGVARMSDSDSERLSEAKMMLREADTNGDGKISREEFFYLLKESHAPDSLSFYDDRLSLEPDGRAAPARSGAPQTAAKL